MISSNDGSLRKGVAAGLSLLVHVGVVVGLLFVLLPQPAPQEEEMEGILVDLGDTFEVRGGIQQEEVTAETPQAEAYKSEPMEVGDTPPLLTQDTSEAPEVPTTPPIDKVTEAKKDAELKRAKEEEARRLAEEAERRKRAQIRKNVSGAFGNIQKSKGSGTSQSGENTGKKGTATGNIVQGGTSSGVGGFGSYSLSGRSLIGALPRPSFTAQVEGSIVVQITVNPSGEVINVQIGTGTTITDYDMRQSALKAAHNARFTSSDGINNQVGHITYKYRLK